MQALIDAGAGVNARDSEGQAVLAWASRTGRTGAVKALLAGGADVHAKNSSGNTAKTLAEGAGHRQTAQLLAAAADA